MRVPSSSSGNGSFFLPRFAGTLTGALRTFTTSSSALGSTRSGLLGGVSPLSPDPEARPVAPLDDVDDPAPLPPLGTFRAVPDPDAWLIGASTARVLGCSRASGGWACVMLDSRRGAMAGTSVRRCDGAESAAG